MHQQTMLEKVITITANNCSQKSYTEPISTQADSNLPDVLSPSTPTHLFHEPVWISVSDCKLPGAKIGIHSMLFQNAVAGSLVYLVSYIPP